MRKEASMKARDMNILIVAEDCKAVATIAQQFVQANSDVTMVDTIAEATVLLANHSYDAVVAAVTLDDGSGLSLVSHKGPSAPVILIGEAPESDEVLAAIRAGASDVFPQPVDVDGLVTSVRRIVAARRKHRTALTRNKRLRKMTSRLVRDRRELRQRVDLICRDLVSAYQRLAEKVTEQREEPAAQ